MLTHLLKPVFREKMPQNYKRHNPDSYLLLHVHHKMRNTDTTIYENVIQDKFWNQIIPNPQDFRQNCRRYNRRQTEAWRWFEEGVYEGGEGGDSTSGRDCSTRLFLMTRIFTAWRLINYQRRATAFEKPLLMQRHQTLSLLWILLSDLFFMSLSCYADKYSYCSLWFKKKSTGYTCI